MIRTIRIPVDHGNRNVKTTSLIFTTGLNVLDKKPGRGEEYLMYEGKYYTLSEKRIPYQRDKTKDFRFFILTLFAIAKEIHQQKQVRSEDVIQVQLPIGLPPKHFAELYEKYEDYFKGNGQVQELDYCGTKYHIVIQDTMAFPQDFAVMVTQLEKLMKIPKVVGIDIGGFTANYLLMRMGSPDMDYCDSLEMGIITMYNQIISDINCEHDVLLEEADIDSIVKGNTQYYDMTIVKAVEDKVQSFVIDLLHSIRERGIDSKTSYVVFIGGGAILLKRFIEKTDRLGQYMFIEDLRANAIGYGILYQMTKTEE